MVLTGPQELHFESIVKFCEYEQEVSRQKMSRPEIFID